MSSSAPSNLAASVRARLKNKSKEQGLPFDQILQYYVMERFLFRLSKTKWANSLIVKGAAMLRVWDGAIARPTKDIDFLGRIDGSPESINRIVLDCLAIESNDGVEFSRDVAITEITVEDRYPGARVVIQCSLSGARIKLQLDIGIADVAHPEPGWVDYPTLLGDEAARVQAYHPATAVAEKYQTMVEKGLLNSRVKDYYDIWMLSHSLSFQGQVLRDSIVATFASRATVIPRVLPNELTSAYTDQATARNQWASFAKKLRDVGIDAPNDLSEIVLHIGNFLMPVSVAAANDDDFLMTWDPTGGWA